MEAKKETFVKILIESFGNISKACKSIGITRRTYYNWLEKDLEFKQEVDSIEEYVVDEVENHLFDQIRDGSTAATIFYLKTKGKHRGYVEKQEIDNKSSDGSMTPKATTIVFTKNNERDRD